jgi:di/tricarboxylate transporter
MHDIFAMTTGLGPVHELLMSAELLPLHEMVFFAILAVAIGLLVTERLRTDLVALLIILSLAVTGLLSPDQALEGFKSEPAIVIACVFVLGAGLKYTGLSETLGYWAGRLAGGSLTRMLAVLMPFSALASAFTHHVTITAVMLPTTVSLAKARQVPASKLLMPMAVGSSLGTTLTIIGAPSFLVASALLRQSGRPGLDVFSIAPIGVVLTLVGTLFMVLLGRFLLPTRQGTGDTSSRFRLDGYFTELRVLPGSPLAGKTVKQIHADRAYRFTIAGWARDGHHLRAPLGDRTLQAGDVLLIHTTPGGLVALREERGVELEPVAKFELAQDGASARHDEDPAERLTQAIVAPGSNLVGRTLAEVDFRRQYGALVVALWRKGGFVPEQLSQIRLREGDTLVLLGEGEALARVGQDHDFLMLVPFHGEPRRSRKALLAGGIMLATIATAAFGWLSLAMAALGGAAAMVLTRCISPRQAYRSIDAPMFLFVAGAIPLGKAMKESGAADLLAGGVHGLIGGWSEMLILLTLFAVVGVVVQFMGSDSATTALFGPLAIALATTLGHAPEAYIVTVAMAAVTAVLTPMCHHNLMIYAPGGYRFTDFFRVGAPLTVLIGLIVAAMAPVLWHA